MIWTIFAFKLYQIINQIIIEGKLFMSSFKSITLNTLSITAIIFAFANSNKVQAQDVDGHVLK